MEEGHQDKTSPDNTLPSLFPAPAQIGAKDSCKGTMGQGGQKGPGQAYLNSIEDGIKKVFKGSKTQSQGHPIDYSINRFIKIRVFIMQPVDSIRLQAFLYKPHYKDTGQKQF